MTHFFGEYSLDPNSFRFSHDERCLILSLVRHVNQSYGMNDLTKGIEELNLKEKTVMNGSYSSWYFKDFERVEPNIELNDENIVEIMPEIESQTHYVLRKLLETADQNKSRSKPGYRFDPEVKKWAAYFRIVAGPTGYTVIQKNLDLALPSLSRMNYIIQNKAPKMIEGVPRCEELLIYLKERNLPLTVSLSEDGTRIQNRVQYDSRRNILVGFVPPLGRNGMPIPLAFKARHTEEIVEHFCNNTPISNHFNTVMAQPIGKAPPFCLLVFGTGNRFVAEDAAERWNYLKDELKMVNITVLTISSDSDTKFNRAMRKNSHLGRSSDIFDGEWFKSGRNVDSPPFYVQDTPHIGGKMRNLLVKTKKYPKLLQFGKNNWIQLDHLQFLVDHFPRDRHQLTQTILTPADRQNFGSVLRICDSKVLQMLRDHVPESAATVKYLEIIKNFLDSYMDEALCPLDRVSKLWYSMFLLRIWKRYVSKSRHLKLKDNFIHWNCFSCLEHNAHAMVLIIMFLNSSNQPNLFKPWLYSSQPCEGFYRLIRSYSPCYSQVINCTVKEMIDRIHRIQLQNDIGSDNDTNFRYPEKLKLKNGTDATNLVLPNKDEILQEVQRAKQKAIEDAITFGLIDKNDRNIDLNCDIVPYSIKNPYKRQRKRGDEDEMMTQSSEEILDQLIHTTLPNFAEKFADEPIEETSQYTEIFGSDRRKVIKKMSLCWLLRKNEVKLSSDRLIRVRNEPAKKKSRQQQKRATVKHFPKDYIRRKFVRHAEKL